MRGEVVRGGGGGMELVGVLKDVKLKIYHPALRKETEFRLHGNFDKELKSIYLVQKLYCSIRSSDSPYSRSNIRHFDM